MKNKIFIICASLLLSSTISILSATKRTLDESESGSSQLFKKSKVSSQLGQVTLPIMQTDLEDFFISRMEKALGEINAKNYMRALSFLFEDIKKVQIGFHAKTLSTLYRDGFFKDLYETLEGTQKEQGLYSKKLTEIFGMIDISDDQESVVNANHHRIFVHQGTGLLLRIKPLAEQYSLSMYTKNDHGILMRGTNAELTELFAGKKQRAEAFKLYLHKAKDGDVFAIPVPRDPKVSVSLKRFIGDERFEQVQSHAVARLENHLKSRLIGTLGHMVLHTEPLFKQITASIKTNEKPEFDANDEEMFPTLGGTKGKVDASSPIAPKPSEDQDQTTSSSLKKIDIIETSSSSSAEPMISQVSAPLSQEEFDFSSDDYSEEYSSDFSETDEFGNSIPYNQGMGYGYVAPNSYVSYAQQQQMYAQQMYAQQMYAQQMYAQQMYAQQGYYQGN